MRRLLLALLLGLVAAPADAGEMYYRSLGNADMLAANEATGATRVVLRGAEYTLGQQYGMTRFNHAGSNGQALVQGRTNSLADIQLIYRASNGTVVTKVVTDLGGNALVPVASPQLAQDDSFFSFMARDGAGRYSFWRLNVTVDQALDSGYVPPTSYADPRLHLLLDEVKDANPASFESPAHTWSPDGARMAYLDRWFDASGTEMISVRVKDVANLSTDRTADVRLVDTVFATRTWGAVLRWSPVSDQVLNMDVDGVTGGGIWVCYADSPGRSNYVARSLRTVTRTQTVTEDVRSPFWRPDGLRIGVAYKKTTQTKTGTNTVRYPAEINASGGRLTS